MDAGRSCRERDVETRVDDDLHASIRDRHGAANKFEQFTRGEILLADLNPIGALLVVCGSRSGQHVFEGIAGAEQLAIRDVTTQHSTSLRAAVL